MATVNSSNCITGCLYSTHIKIFKFLYYFKTNFLYTCCQNLFRNNINWKFFDLRFEVCNKKEY